MRILYTVVYLMVFLAAAAGANVITGKVIGPDGKTVAGAMVYFDLRFSGNDSLAVKTDKQGRFSTKLDLRACPPDFVGRATVYRQGMALGGGTLRPGENVFGLESAGQAWGSVVDPQGHPVPKATVVLDGVLRGDQPGYLGYVWVPRQLKAKFSVRTTADGRWTIFGVPTSGKALVSLDDPRYVRTRVEALLGPDAVAAPAIVARPAASIKGKAVFQGGKPARGIDVMAQATGSGNNWSETTTSADGSYKLTGLSTGVVNVMVSEPTGKWIAAALEAVKTTEDQVTKVPDLVLTPGAIIEGQVTDATTGKPLAGVHVGSYGPHRPRSSAAIIGSYSGEDGHYRLRVAPGKGYVYISSQPKGYPMQELGVDVTTGPGRTRELPFKLTKGVSLTGVAWDTDGKPVSNALIVIQMVASDSPDVFRRLGFTDSSSATTDSQGRFTITGLKPGKGRISTNCMGMTSEWDVVEPKEVNIPAPGPVDVLLRKLQILSVTGRAVTPEGKPIPGATVQLNVFTSIGGGMSLSTPKQLSTDADGRFSLPDVRADASVRGVVVTKPGYVLISGGEIKKTEQAIQVSDIVLAPLTGVLKGKVVDATGGPVPGAKVISPNADSDAQAETDASGAFTLQSLPQDEVTVVAARGADWGLAKARTGSASLTVALAEPKPLPGNDIQRAYPILESTLKESKGKGYYARDFVPLELAPYDPDLAVKLAQSIDGTDRDVVADVMLTLVETDPARAVSWGLPKLDTVKDPHMFITISAKLGMELAKSDPQAAAELYRKAKAKLEESGSRVEARDYAFLAALAARLRNGEAETMLDKALAAAASLKGDLGSGAMLAEIVADVSPELADKVIASLPAKEQPQARARAIERISRYDPKAALKELALLEAANTDADMSYGLAAKSIIKAIGRTQPAEALALARKVEGRFTRPMALALAARFQERDLAAKVFHEAADAAAASPGSLEGISKIAAMAHEIDPVLGEQLFNEVKTRLKTEKGQVEHLAFYSRAVDPAQSRLMLERRFAELRRAPDSMNPGWSLTKVALAMSGIDIDRALEIAASIPEKEVNARFDAHRKIAQYILAPDLVRATLPFERWTASDTWIPGQPTGW